MKQRLFILCLGAVALTFSAGCFCTKRRGFNKWELVYIYEATIEKEASGVSADPIGNTWERFWRERFKALRARATPKENFEDVIAYVKRLRASKGLPPVE